MVDDVRNYLERSRSALEALCAAVDNYLGVLDREPIVTGPGWSETVDEVERQARIEQWYRENQEAIERRAAAEREYFAESFALAAICGSILQIAHIAIQVYSRNDAVPDVLADGSRLPEPLRERVTRNTAARRAAIGRPVLGLPLGLLVYAGRNQYAHMDDQDLNEPGKSIFLTLAARYGLPNTWDNPQRPLDPAFKVPNPAVPNMAGNIRALLGWSTFEHIQRDLVEAVESAPVA